MMYPNENYESCYSAEDEIFRKTLKLRLEDLKNCKVPAVMKTMDMMEAAKSVHTGKGIRRYAIAGKQKKPSGI